MRYVLRRINPWSAAKVGAMLGLVAGLVLGVVLYALGTVVASMLAYFGESVDPVAWPVVFLFSLLVGSAAAVGSAVLALLYNVMARLGAALELRLDEGDEVAPGSGRAKKPEADPLKGAFLDARDTSFLETGES